MTRLELPDGQWADLKEWLTHGEEKAVLRAWAIATQRLEEAPDLDTALVRAYVAEWHVLGRDGHELPLTDIDEAPGKIVAAIVAVANERWKNRRADPKAPAG